MSVILKLLELRKAKIGRKERVNNNLAFSFLKIINVLFTCPPELNKYNPAIHGGEKSKRQSGFSPKRQQQSG
jgi:hypothetical protein